ncbi:MAG: sulfite exporter TauE/SafE family protein [Bdellovibrionota bacterium]
MPQLIYHDYFWILMATSFMTSVVSASVGFLGGTILLAVMAQFLPPEVLIPVHGLVQLWANSTRAAFLIKDIQWRIVGHYAGGTLLGSLIASQFVLKIPEAIYNIGLGYIILVLTLAKREVWSKFFVASTSGNFRFLNKWALTGFVASFVGLFVGAIGILVGSVFLTEKNLEKKMMVGTQAVCQALVHLAKIVVFVYLGFHIGPWLGLLSGLIFTTLAGSFFGTRILDKIPQDLFVTIFRMVIIILATRLILIGVNYLMW